MTYRPDTEIQRAQLIQARDAHRQKGFACEIDLATLDVQDGLAGESVDAKRAELENLRDNSYAAARKCDEMLKALPKAKEQHPNPATRKK
jgi:hypothetical protein